MHATTRLGGIVSGASPAYNVEEMTYALKTGKAKFLMTIPSSMEIAAAAAKAAGIPQDRIFILEGKLDGYQNLQDLIAIGKAYGANGQVPFFRIPKGKTNGDVCGFLSFSSGTTGLPKAVFTHIPLQETMLILPGHDISPKCHSPMSTDPAHNTPR